MVDNLPTEPGRYWWRAKDGDEWVFIYVESIGGDLFARSKGTHTYLGAYLDQWKRFYPAGQWRPCPNHDEGIDGWAVFDDSGLITSVDLESSENAWQWVCNDSEVSQSTLERHHYTCEPVIIIRKEKK